MKGRHFRIQREISINLLIYEKIIHSTPRSEHCNDENKISLKFSSEIKRTTMRLFKTAVVSL